jgi:hypothetical protein
LKLCVSNPIGWHGVEEVIDFDEFNIIVRQVQSISPLDGVSGTVDIYQCDGQYLITNDIDLTCETRDYFTCEVDAVSNGVSG